MSVDEQTMTLSLSVDNLKAKADEIAAIDAQLDADSDKAGKVAIQNSLASAHEDKWKSVADKLISAFENIDDVDVFVANYSGVMSALRTKFKERVDTRLTELFDKKQAEGGEQVTLTDEQIAELTTQRREFVEQFKALQNILKLYGQDVSTVPAPKKRTGSRGKRGPRVLTGYTYLVDGEERKGSLSTIASTVTKELGWKVSELRNYLIEKGIDLNDPPPQFEVELPTDPPKTLTAVKGVVTASDEEDEEDDEEEDGEEE